MDNTNTNKTDIFNTFSTMLLSSNDYIKGQLRQALLELNRSRNDRHQYKNIEATVRGLEATLEKNNKILSEYKEVFKTYKGYDRMVNACDQFIVNGLLSQMQDSREREQVLKVFRSINEEKEKSLNKFRELLTDPKKRIALGGTLTVDTNPYTGEKSYSVEDIGIKGTSFTHVLTTLGIDNIIDGFVEQTTEESLGKRESAQVYDKDVNIYEISPQFKTFNGLYVVDPEVNSYSEQFTRDKDAARGEVTPKYQVTQDLIEADFPIVHERGFQVANREYQKIADSKLEIQAIEQLIDYIDQNIESKPYYEFDEDLSKNREDRNKKGSFVVTKRLLKERRDKLIEGADKSVDKADKLYKKHGIDQENQKLNARKKAQELSAMFNSTTNNSTSNFTK